MGEKENSSSPENERNLEAILDVLEAAFEKGTRARLTVSEPSGSIKTNEVFVEGLKAGYLYIAVSKDSPVMGIKIEDVLGAEPLEK